MTVHRHLGNLTLLTWACGVKEARRPVKTAGAGSTPVRSIPKHVIGLFKMGKSGTGH